jgi:hypothetical protein
MHAAFHRLDSPDDFSSTRFAEWIKMGDGTLRHALLETLSGMYFVLTSTLFLREKPRSSRSKGILCGIHISSVVNPECFFSDPIPDLTFQRVSDPNPDPNPDPDPV